MSVLLPYLVPMLLGRSIDLTSYSIGNDIYDGSSYVEQTLNTTTADYSVVQGKSFPYEEFGIPIDIVLRIKTNYISSSSGFMGLDGLLKDTSWMYNSVVLPVVVKHTTVARSLDDNAELFDRWNTSLSGNYTHYSSKLTYGGWFVVVFRYKCDVPSDVDSIRRVLTETLGASGSVHDVLDKWRVVEEQVRSTLLRGKYTVNTYVYSSVLLQEEIDSPESLMRAIKELPNSINGIGEPLFMELRSLRDVDPRFPEVTRSNSTSEELAKLDLMFDDAKNTRISVMRWIQESTTEFSDDEDHRISVLLDSLNQCIRVFYEIMASISIYKPLDDSFFEVAFATYLFGLEKGVGSYNLAYRMLKEDIDAECENDFGYGMRGLLKVYDADGKKVQDVGSGGIKACQALCLKENRCRAIGYADKLSKLDMETGSYHIHTNQCWIYYRSTNTAVLETPPGLSGDIKVYDRKCQ